jgi:hypothetical protein
MVCPFTKQKGAPVSLPATGGMATQDRILSAILPGVVLFVRFLAQHPLPPAEVRHV